MYIQMLQESVDFSIVHLIYKQYFCTRKPFNNKVRFVSHNETIIGPGA